MLTINILKPLLYAKDFQCFVILRKTLLGRSSHYQHFEMSYPSLTEIKVNYRWLIRLLSGWAGIWTHQHFFASLPLALFNYTVSWVETTVLSWTLGITTETSMLPLLYVVCKNHGIQYSNIVGNIHRAFYCAKNYRCIILTATPRDWLFLLLLFPGDLTFTVWLVLIPSVRQMWKVSPSSFHNQ